MCPHTDAVPDPEAQRPPAPPGPACRPLPWALGVALLLVAGTCAACWVSTWGASQVPTTASPGLPDAPEPPPDACARLRDSPQAAFAQLVAQDVQLTEGPLRWYSNPALSGVFLGPGLSYDQHTRELTVTEPGIYYVFLNLKVQRVVSGASGPSSISIALHLQPPGAGAAALALTLDLPPSSSDSASGFRASLLHLGAGQRLGVHLRAEGGAHPAWQLAQGATILGLFRVATKVPAGLTLPLWPIDTGPGHPPLDRE